MDSTYSYPKLRWPLDIRFHSVGEDQALLIRCPLGFSDQPLLLVPAVAPVLSCFEGSLSFQQILERFAPDGLTQQTLEELIKLLDQHAFLANARFFALERSVRDSFKASEVREPALAGLNYPSSAQELKNLIDGFLVPYDAPKQKRLAGLIAPHIDYQRGSKCYGKIYPRLSESRADTFILIGTAHQYSRGIFHLCAKDFRSPLATHRCDTSFISALASRYGVERAFADQFLHRREHSLELQLPFISRIKPDAVIAPILVGSFHSMIASDRYPHEWEEYESFAAAVTELIRERTQQGASFCFLAGVDMAHVGRAFGDAGSLSPDTMARVAERDQLYLNAVEAGDKKGLFDHIAEDYDARRMCGFPTLYTMLDVHERLGLKPQCEVVSYDQAVDYSSDCAVTFAGVAMYAVKLNHLS